VHYDSTASHEEADTRLVLHAIDASRHGCSRIVVHSKDTDVLVLLLHFYPSLTHDVWMKTGTLSKPVFIPIHELYQTLPSIVFRNLPAYHALTGSDTTSQFAGHGKKPVGKHLHPNRHFWGGLASENLMNQSHILLSNL